MNSGKCPDGDAVFRRLGVAGRDLVPEAVLNEIFGHLHLPVAGRLAFLHRDFFVVRIGRVVAEQEANAFRADPRRNLAADVDARR